ncbi:malonamidase E2 [Fulvimarina pelagi HTCC2506]|uniref:Malonamidase E2 n=1 Tax=Fulvimarina pelagi HTCC2506 TaxID=314231 RepID=Q0G1Y5_9HYPH|nr:amidase [Fulvimarina pelagi]EAU41413.1 malonamidase E2 [Fulvimarina pelagi HTCC2506]
MSAAALDRHRLSVCDILAAIEDGALAPADVVAESRSRITARDAEVGAFVTLADETASAIGGPLSGIPVGIKDIFDTSDMPTEMGSSLYAGHRPRFDATLVSMARTQGAAIVGKTVTTELASLDPAGTNNPAAPGHTPGGSSSGSAAAVAAGFCAAAYGSQTGASVVRPAAFCGIAGFKPSFRLLPTVGMKTFAWSLDTAGLFAASVRDVALFADLLTGRALRVRDELSLAGLTLGFYRTKLDDSIEPAMVDALDRTRRAAEKAGVRIIDLDEPGALEEGRDAHTAIQGYEASRALMHEQRSGGDSLGPKVKAILDDGAGYTPEEYDIARRAARVARKAANGLFESVDAIVAPSAFGPAPKGLSSTGDPTIAKLWTLTGNPVVNVPGLATENGLPLGISIVARFGRDARVLAIAAGLERTFSGV